jgi:cyclopropane-fatty-acyl-phospholipid synthase
VITANAIEWDTDVRFDRVLSVEMFEHMRNYEVLLRRVTGWLAPGGRLFTHVFCCREYGYHFAEADGWMAQNFFTGGIMPREDQFEQFPSSARLIERWWVPGTHYERTCNDWLARLDANHDAVLATCREAYGDSAGACFSWRALSFSGWKAAGALAWCTRSWQRPSDPGSPLIVQ